MNTHEAKTDSFSQNGTEVSKTMNPTTSTMNAMIDDITAKRDTTETILGTPVIRYAHFTRDFKDIVRRLIDPSKTETHNSNAEETGVGHPPQRVMTENGWEETGWAKKEERIVLSVACRVKGIKTKYTKTIEGWSHRKTEEWITKKEWVKKEWTEAQEKRKAWNDWEYDPKIQTKWVEDYLPDDDQLRIDLNNLFSAYTGDDLHADTALDTMCDPFKNNAGW